MVVRRSRLADDGRDVVEGEGRRGFEAFIANALAHEHERLAHRTVESRVPADGREGNEFAVPLVAPRTRVDVLHAAVLPDCEVGKPFCKGHQRNAKERKNQTKNEGKKTHPLTSDA